MYGSTLSPWLWKVSLALWTPMKPLPFLDGVEQGRLLCGGHGRVVVAAGLGQIARGVEKEGVVPGEVFRRENPSVLAEGELDVVRGRELGQDRLDMAGLDRPFP